MNNEFVAAIEEFPWHSKEQKEGYLAFVHYCKSLGKDHSVCDIDLLGTFLIQKNHESAGYFSELIGSQISTIQDDIHRLQETVRNQGMLIEQLIQK